MSGAGAGAVTETEDKPPVPKDVRVNVFHIDHQDPDSMIEVSRNRASYLHSAYLWCCWRTGDAPLIFDGPPPRNLMQLSRPSNPTYPGVRRIFNAIQKLYEAAISKTLSGPTSHPIYRKNAIHSQIPATIKAIEALIEKFPDTTGTHPVPHDIATIPSPATPKCSFRNISSDKREVKRRRGVFEGKLPARSAACASIASTFVRGRPACATHARYNGDCVVHSSVFKNTIMTDHITLSSTPGHRKNLAQFRAAHVQRFRDKIRGQRRAAQLSMLTVDFPRPLVETIIALAEADLY